MRWKKKCQPCTERKTPRKEIIKQNGYNKRFSTKEENAKEHYRHSQININKITANKNESIRRIDTNDTNIRTINIQKRRSKFSDEIIDCKVEYINLTK